MDAFRQPLARDAVVHASDGILGTLAETVIRPANDEIAYLIVKVGLFSDRVLVPANLIESIPSDQEVLLRATRDEIQRLAAEIPSEMLVTRDGARFTIPIFEERLVPGTRQVDLGELRIHKHVDTEEEVIRQPVQRDDVIVERVPVNRMIDQPEQARFDGDWFVLPVMEEVLVVEKRLVLREEVRVRKQEITVEDEVREVRRRERVEIEMPPGMAPESYAGL